MRNRDLGRKQARSPRWKLYLSSPSDANLQERAIYVLHRHQSGLLFRIKADFQHRRPHVAVSARGKSFVLMVLQEIESRWSDLTHTVITQYFSYSASVGSLCRIRRQRPLNCIRMSDAFFLSLSSQRSAESIMHHISMSWCFLQICMMSFRCWAQKKMFYRMMATKQLTAAIHLHSMKKTKQKNTMEVNECLLLFST